MNDTFRDRFLSIVLMVVFIGGGIPLIIWASGFGLFGLLFAAVVVGLAVAAVTLTFTDTFAKP